MKYETFKTNYENKLSTLTDKKVISDYKRMFSMTNKNITFNNPEEVFNKYFKKTNYKLGTCTKYFTYFSACLNTDKNTHKIFCDYCRELKKQCNKESKKEHPIKIYINIQETPEYTEFLKSLYTNYSPLRSDYCTVKLNNYNKETDNYYENGVIYFNKLVKVPRNYIIEKNLNENDIKFIENLKKLQDNLYECKSDDLNKSFCSFLKNKTGYSVNEYRRLFFTNLVNKLNINLENVHILMNACVDSNTSIDKVYENYYREIQYENE